MKLWNRADKLSVTDYLRFAFGGSVKGEAAKGVVSEVSQADFINSVGGVETLSAARTLTAADSGKTFFLGLAGGFTVTLPAPAAGLRLKFVVSVQPTTAYIIVTNGSANILIGGVNELAVTTGNNGPSSAVGDQINLVASTADVGDYLDMISDGTSWYFSGQTAADGGVTIGST